MGEKSRRKREERARAQALKRLAEKNRAGSKTLHGARARISIGGKEIGVVNDITFRNANDFDHNGEVFVLDSMTAMGVPRDDRHGHMTDAMRYSMSAEVKGTFKIIEPREELERRLALAEARARDLEAVLGDRLEEQGMPRSPMLARLAKVPDVERALQALYRLGIGPQTSGSMLFAPRAPSCCESQALDDYLFGPTVHANDCPLQAALLVLGGAEEEKRREIEFKRRAGRDSERQRRTGGGMLVVSPRELAAYRTAFRRHPGGVGIDFTGAGIVTPPDPVPVFAYTETEEAVQRLVDDIHFQLTPAPPPGEPPHE